jgi:hypothetical protein
MNKLVVTLLVCTLSGLAQQKAPATTAYNRVIIFHLKPDMAAEWVALQKNEVAPAEKKGGMRSRTAYQTILGDTNEYMIVVPLDKYAELDEQSALIKGAGAEAAAAISAKTARCLESRQVFISTPQAALSFEPEKGATDVAVFTRRRVAPGRIDDFNNFMKTEVLPSYKKTGDRITTSRRGLGANNNDFVSVSWMNKLTDLDKGPATTRVLGADAAAKMNFRLAAIAQTVEQVVRRRVPELSF